MQKAYDLHKPIRNYIKKYQNDVLLAGAINNLLKNEAQISPYLPWESMLLIRWIIQYDEPNYQAQVPNNYTINFLLSKIRDIYNELDRIDLQTTHGLEKFMRRTAFQQFSYQIPVQDMALKAARQVIIFTDIGEKYKINEKFKEKTGLSIKDFLSLSLALFSIIQQDSIFKVTVADLDRFFDKGLVEKFFKLISLNKREAKNFLHEDSITKGKYFALQLYELSPLYKKPLLNLNGNYVIYSKRLFNYFFGNFIYDFLYNLPESETNIGRLLEHYIKQQLEKLHVRIIYDKSWKKILGKEIKTPDFTILEKNSTIFIESKRKDLPTIAKVLQTNQVMSNNLDDSIVGGVVQAYSLAHELIQRGSDFINNRNNIYSIVVNYKEHYINGGSRFWEEFLGEEIKRELKKLNIDHSIISPEKIFILSIDDFDYLINYLANNPQTTFHETLEKVIEFEKSPSLRRFFFREYLSMIESSNTPQLDHLRQRIEILFDEIIALVSSKKQQS